MFEECPFLIASLMCAVAGGLIGYGYYGSIQAMCLGIDLSMITPAVIIFGLIVLD